MPLLSRTDWNVIGLALVTEVLTLAFGAFAFEIGVNARVGNLLNALAIWNVWDAPHYIDIAMNGYRGAGDQRLFIVFFPLFPWMIRAVTWIIRDPLISAFIVSGAASIAAGVALARLAALDYPESVAYQAAWFLFIFPTAYFLHIGYTESLFLALVITSFLAARRDRWFSASVLGALASLARMNGVLLAPALGAEVLHRMWSERRWRWEWLWIGIIPSGFGAYLMLNYVVTGDPFTFRQYELSHWSQSLTWPWEIFKEMPGAFKVRTPYDAQMLTLQVGLYLGIGLGAVLGSIFLMRPSYSVWMVSNWLLVAGLTWDLSAPRYVLGLFPMFILLARLARNRVCYAIITFWSLLSMALFAASFVRGTWAF